MINESTVLERIAEAIDDTTQNELARLHNTITNYPTISPGQIKLEEGWHLVPKEGAH